MIRKNLTVTGRTVLAPTIPTAGMKENKFNHSQPISQKNSKDSIAPLMQITLKSTDKQTITSAEIIMASKENMIKLKKQIEKLVKDTNDITLYNHSPIFLKYLTLHLLWHWILDYIFSKYILLTI